MLTCIFRKVERARACRFFRAIVLAIGLPGLFAGCVATSNSVVTPEVSILLHDASRDREIPVAIYIPRPAMDTPRVALLSSGYGEQHTAYSFIAEDLMAHGFVVVAVQHELPTDLPLASAGDLFTERLPNWTRGTENLSFVLTALADEYRQYDWSGLLLVGHSNGGDISALFAHTHPDQIAAVITLDNRRYPVPRNENIRVLSVRAADFEADAGVLPSVAEESRYPIQIVKLGAARHNDMHDGGNDTLKHQISDAIRQFLDPR